MGPFTLHKKKGSQVVHKKILNSISSLSRGLFLGDLFWHSEDTTKKGELLNKLIEKVHHLSILVVESRRTSNEIKCNFKN